MKFSLAVLSLAAGLAIATPTPLRAQDCTGIDEGIIAASGFVCKPGTRGATATGANGNGNNRGNNNNNNGGGGGGARAGGSRNNAANKAGDRDGDGIEDSQDTDVNGFDCSNEAVAAASGFPC
ncbi:hypothetical protein CSOJ01_09501 [Colletotrichum sojae]|uniref:Uncharacterized protein n=1 Tax=Colletotrichum sojae TaxID=2175907 RepID=A0A8H6MRD4_9PEZI|nr:hypothetical protein CSOJ01_09501 [Colletotrichum sojae]